MMTLAKARPMSLDLIKIASPEKAPAKQTHRALSSPNPSAGTLPSSVLHAAVCLQGSSRSSGAIGRHASQDAAHPPRGHKCRQVTLRGSSPASHGKTNRRVLQCLKSIPPFTPSWSLPMEVGTPVSQSALRRRRAVWAQTRLLAR